MYKITVGICVYKQYKWLFRCLRSLASQKISKNNFEIIIVNDDPESDISEICNNLKDVLNIRLINNSENIGLPRSLNKILNTSRGRYFVRIDADDYVSSHFLYMLSIFLDLNRNYQAISCDYKKVDSIGRVKSYHSFAEEPIACGIMFTYDSIFESGLYDENFKMREGHDLLIRFKKKFNLFSIPIPLYRYRMHSDNRTSNLNQIKKFDEKLKIIHKENNS